MRIFTCPWWCQILPLLPWCGRKRYLSSCPHKIFYFVFTSLTFILWNSLGPHGFYLSTSPTLAHLINFLRVSLVHPILLITPSLAIRSLPNHLHPPLSFPYVYIYIDFTSLKLIFIHPQTFQLFTSTSLPPSFLFCKFSTAISCRLHRDKSRDDRSPTWMIF